MSKLFGVQTWAALLALVGTAVWFGGGYAGAAADEADDSIEQAAGLFELLLDADAETAGKCLRVLAEKVQSGELKADQVRVLRERLDPKLQPILAAGQPHALHADVALLAVSWRDAKAAEAVRRMFQATDVADDKRLRALGALIAASDERVLAAVAGVLAEPAKHSAGFRAAVLAALGRMSQPAVAEVVLKEFAKLEPDLKPKAIELLTQRAAWSKSLLRAIGDGKLPKESLNAAHVGKLLAGPDEELKQLVARHWGTLRTDRDPQREKVIGEMRKLLSETAGDPKRGVAVFEKVCGQCHKLHGKGQEVGPDITNNGRNSFEQLLSNVFDPSLVIGASYQARTVITADGRVLSGLLAEDNEQRIVLKMQGGKLETLPRDQIEELKISPLSLMPEGLEKQLQPQELADLFAYLTADLAAGKTP